MYNCIYLYLVTHYEFFKKKTKFTEYLSIRRNFVCVRLANRSIFAIIEIQFTFLLENELIYGFYENCFPYRKACPGVDGWTKQDDFHTDFQFHFQRCIVFSFFCFKYVCINTYITLKNGSKVRNIFCVNYYYCVF